MAGRTASCGYETNSNFTKTVSYSIAISATVGTRIYTNAGSLSSIIWTGPGGVTRPLPGHTYTPDSAGRRHEAAREDGSTWIYDYNNRSEVVLGERKQGVNVQTGWHFGYDYDSMGNRTSYSPDPGTSIAAINNSAGQLTGPANPSSRVYLGRAKSGATVSVTQGTGSSLAVTRAGEEFSAVVNRTTGWEALSTSASLSTGTPPPSMQITGSLYMPPPGETLTYDLDGNLATDWRWTYTWDRENRLTSMTTNAAAVSAGIPKLKLDYVYDSFGRRIQKSVSSWSGTAWTLFQEQRFVYDGWNLIAEVSTVKPASTTLTKVLQPLRAYAWGLDLSGTEQGAGGVGGLLLVQQFNASGSVQTLAPAYDGNGNVCAYFDAATGAVVDRYEYDPFGRTIVAEELVK